MWYSHHLTSINSNLIQVDVVVLPNVAADPCTKNITFLGENDGSVLTRGFTYLLLLCWHISSITDKIVDWNLSRIIQYVDLKSAL